VRLPRSVDDLRGLRAARWVRESTGGQFDSFGPEAQREQQDRAIDRFGLVDSGLAWSVAHSGRTVGNTAAFREMFDRAGTAFDVLVVGYVSRFARDLRTAVNARHDLHAAGAAILFCDERVLTSDEDAWELFAREAVEAEAYSRRLGKRIKEGYAAKFRQLRDQGGNAPLGFHRVGQSHALAVDPRTIDSAVRMFERYASGTVSIDEAAAEAALAGDRVRSMLANPIYNGWVRRYGRSRHGDKVSASWRASPPVDDDLWERVQEVRRLRTRGLGAPRRRKAIDPLSGLLHCLCGRRIRANGTSGSPPKHQRIHPGHCEAWGGPAAVWSSMHGDAIDAQVSGIRLDDATIERVVRALGSGPTVGVDDRAIEREKRELALQHAADRVDDATYLARMAELRRRPLKSDTSAVPATAAVAWLRDLAALWKSGSGEAKAQLIRSVYERIDVTREGFAQVILTRDAYRRGLAVAMSETVLVDRVMARPAGFEPATWWSEATRSIH
jgi:DNA invertase Pin-like site-specific DNA recombinase